MKMRSPWMDSRAAVSFLFLVLLTSEVRASETEGERLTLWYEQPAAEWTEALPVGNGRLGAMVFGGVTEERVQFNKDTLSIGQPHDYSRPGAHEHLQAIRELLFGGQQQAAEQLAMERFMSVPLRQLPYQPFGDVILRFSGQDDVTEAATSFRTFQDARGEPGEVCSRVLASIRTKSWRDLWLAHQEDHRRLFRRVALDLGKGAGSGLPTDERLRRNEGENDPDLAALIFQYGRYLLIACSRPGSQPANLQGIWNDRLEPPWESKCTCNSNTQMNL